MSEISPEQVLDCYLKNFSLAWKRAYKLFWVFRRVEEELHLNAIELAELAQTHKFPLFPSAAIMDRAVNVNCTYFVVHFVSKKFSDWLFDKTPDEAKFVATVLRNKDTLHAKSANECCKNINVARAKRYGDKQEAQKAFGGTVELCEQQLKYLSMGRTTGKGQGSGFGVKSPRLKLKRA